MATFHRRTNPIAIHATLPLLLTPVHRPINMKREYKPPRRYAEHFMSTVSELLLVWLVTVGLFLPAADLPPKPLLRLETGMHTAAIRSLAVDATGRLLLTASDDGTARLWTPTTGRLLMILRPPMGDADEGRLSSCAITPDGTLAALGRSSDSGQPSRFVFLFDLASGNLLWRIPNLPGAPTHLAFSRDGSRLAISLSKGGLRIVRTVDGLELARDVAYGAPCTRSDFEAEGRLATASDDGQIRIYDPEGKLMIKVAAPGSNKRLGSVRFSPDGSRLAVGYSNEVRVGLYSAPDLTAQPQPNCTGLAKGSGCRLVGWSADGRTLFAGGTLSGKGKLLVRGWSDGGRGGFKDAEVPSFNNGILDLVALPQGGVLWATEGPAWGYVSGGQCTGEKADFAGINLGLDRAGATVIFQYAGNGEVFRFDSSTRRLQAGAGSGQHAPLTTGLAIKNWKNGMDPTLEGKPIPVAGMSRCLAVAPDLRSFLIGSAGGVDCIDAQGNRIWNNQGGGRAWALNISGDGSLGVAAYHDGTIRWHQMSDGKELLAFFPHRDKKRWVLWTPSGYYDASPGGEDLIGWLINRGKDQVPDFFPGSRLKATYFRPSILSKVLETRDEGTAIAAANLEQLRRAQPATGPQLPPIVRILSPTFESKVNTNSVAVRVAVRHPKGQPIDSVWACVDGRRVEIRGLRPQQEQGENQTYTLDVPIPSLDCIVSIFARCGETISEPASVHLAWENARQTAAVQAQGFVIKPKLYLLAVGVALYKDPSLKLDYPTKDAKDLAAAFKAQEGPFYREVEVRLITDGEATKESVLDGLEWLERQVTAKDLAVVFLAGHGINDNSGQYYFLPANADPKRVKGSMVANSDVQSTLAKLPGKVIMFLDTCHSGNILWNVKQRGASDVNGFINELASAENGVVVFSASTGRQGSQESPEWGNGAFTKAVIEGLSGKADFQKTGRITLNMLDLYISERVKELTKGTQSPTTAKPTTIQDFPIASTRAKFD
jgi:WD40 repeat protein